jgi:acetyltransferase-like isoleucine patch superfamily enzyme
MILKVLTFFLPWPLRRRALNSWFGFQIHPSARIGLSWIFPKKLIMAPGAYIDHFNVAMRLDKITMEENSRIGRSNWITGFPIKSESGHFKHQLERKSELLLCESAAIIKHHHIDCTNLIRIGRFSHIGGYNSQLLTHSVDYIENRQHSKPIDIGDYALVGTNSVVLGGSILPSNCILSAKSLLNKALTEQWKIYGGVPAKEISEIPKDAKYFHRTEAYIV